MDGALRLAAIVGLVAIAGPGRAATAADTLPQSLAQCAADIAAAEAFVNAGIAAYAQGLLTPEAASAIKLHTSEMFGRVADACLQLFGGYGYMAEYPIARFWTDARVLRIYGGTSEIMKELVARSLLGR